MTNKGSIQCKPAYDRDRIKNFDCGDGAINAWYDENAFENNEISKSYHLIKAGRPVGFFAIYNTSLRRSKFSQFHGDYKEYPSEVPVICIGQYALIEAFRASLPAKGTQEIPHEEKYSSQGIFHALKVCVVVQRKSGGRGIILHPSNDRLIPFYEELGFEKIRQESKKVVMYMSIERARAIVSRREPSR